MARIKSNCGAKDVLGIFILINMAGLVLGIDVSALPVNSWSVVGVLSIVSSLCFIVVLMGCALLCPRKSERDYPGDDPFPDIQFPNSSARDGFSMYPPNVNTPAPRNTANIQFDPLPDVAALRAQKRQGDVQGNMAELRPKVVHVGRERLDSEGEDFDLGVGSGDVEKVKLDKALLNRSSQCSRTQLQYVRELGNGWFGKVLQAEGDSILPGHKKTSVIVQMLREDASMQDQYAFIQEGALYRDLDHVNVLKVIACCVESMPYLTVLELCSNADLKSYLRSQRPNLEVIDKQGLLLNFACDITAGLQAMHQANYVHRDFALRNCLVTSELSVKVGDYGLSEEVYKEEYYFDSNGVALPIRWLAPEVMNIYNGTVSLRHITKDSNLWSFGVVLWELMSFGAMPYSELTNEQVLQSVITDRSVALPKPDVRLSNIDRLYQLMCLCWSSPSQRPSLRELRIMLLHLCSNKDETDFVDFDRKWNQMLPRQTSQIIPATIDHVDITFSPPEEILSSASPSYKSTPGRSIPEEFDFSQNFGVIPKRADVFDGKFYELDASSLLVHSLPNGSLGDEVDADWTEPGRYRNKRASLKNDLSLEDELSSAMNSSNLEEGSRISVQNNSNLKTGPQRERLLPLDGVSELNQAGKYPFDEKERMLAGRLDAGSSEEGLSSGNGSEVNNASPSRHSPTSERDDWSMIDHNDCHTSSPNAAGNERKIDTSSTNSFTCIPDTSDAFTDSTAAKVELRSADASVPSAS